MICVADLLWRSFDLRRSSIGKLTSSVPWLVPIDNLETQKKSISMKNSQFFDYLLYAKSK
jgi:hypothetical protein